jgi:uncharacterized protein (DUF1800 family)
MDQDQLLHLLRRTGFGPTPGDLAAYEGSSRAQVVAALLDASANPAVVMPSSVSRTDAGNMGDLEQWWYERMRTTATPLLEKMTLFWHGHFASSESKVFDPLKMWNQNVTLRQGALGSFEDLFQAVAIDPAMLVYLDNDGNHVGGPNENWARESMELMSLGLDQYTQDDVTAAARAWTGYNLDARGQLYQYWPTRHDNGPETFFGITQSWAGPDIIHEICTGAKASTCARFIANKLWKHFTGQAPSATNLAQLAGAFFGSGMNISALMTAILDNDAFYDPSVGFGSVVRSPTEFLVAAARFLGIPAATAHPEWWGSKMGQQLFYPPNVAGWADGGAWISTAAAQAKGQFATYLAYTAYSQSGLSGLAGMSPAAAAARMMANVGVPSASPATLAQLEAWAATPAGRRSDAARSWGLAVLALTSPEFSLS